MHGWTPWASKGAAPSAFGGRKDTSKMELRDWASAMPACRPLQVHGSGSDTPGNVRCAASMAVSSRTWRTCQCSASSGA